MSAALNDPGVHHSAPSLRPTGRLLSGLATLAVLACLPAHAAFGGEVLDRAAETEHVIFRWSDGAVGEEGLAYGQRRAEEHIRAIVHLLGVEPREKIEILLRGPAERPDGSRGYPRVDRQGRIHLYRFGPTYHGYFGAVPHEMVHTLRIDRGRGRDWFFEEGFAEFVALRAGKSMRGFPWYEASLAVATGHWLIRGEDIPLGVLREKHREVSLPCKAQSYTLRSDFFDFLGRRFGDEAVIRMSRRPDAGAPEHYREAFGSSLEDLEKAWREDLLSRYRATEDTDEKARRYREETPIQYMDICRKGEDF